MRMIRIISYCSFAGAMLWSCQSTNTSNELRNDVVNGLQPAASVSKPVAAIGAMTLVHKGVLEPDTDINDLAEGWQIPPVPLPKYVAPIELAENQLEEYTGNYAINDLDIQITSDPSGLNFEGAGIQWQLIPTQTDTLEIADMEGQVFFRRDEKNAITGLHMWFGEPDWSPYRAWDFAKMSSE